MDLYRTFHHTKKEVSTSHLNTLYSSCLLAFLTCIEHFLLTIVLWLNKKLVVVHFVVSVHRWIFYNVVLLLYSIKLQRDKATSQNPSFQITPAHVHNFIMWQWKTSHSQLQNIRFLAFTSSLMSRQFETSSTVDERKNCWISKSRSHVIWIKFGTPESLPSLETPRR